MFKYRIKHLVIITKYSTKMPYQIISVSYTVINSNIYSDIKIKQHFNIFSKKINFI